MRDELEGVSTPSPTLPQARLAALERVSTTLGDFVRHDEEAMRLLAADLYDPPPEDAAREVAQAAGFDGLRRYKRRWLATIAARDAAGEMDVAAVGEALADLADSVLAAALGLVDPRGTLSVVAMGKLGGRELNYYSDIDVMFVASGDPAHAAKPASRLLQELGAASAGGRIYEVDANLRPEGRSGALVRSTAGYLEYYRRWAHHWEFQALIKARVAAGGRDAGDELVSETRRIVFPDEVAAERIAAIRKMKQRVEEHASRGSSRHPATDDVKLGPGGIRDIEFSVQLLQLVHGGSDKTVRSGNTVAALRALVEGGYIAEDDGAGLGVAYRWLRNVEHRLQLRQERRIRTLPASEEDRAALARALGFSDSPAASAVSRFEEAHRAVLADVRGRFEKLFYRPMIETLGTTALTPQALHERLAVLGFRDVQRAARTLEGLVAGVSRRAKLLRVLTPAVLRRLSDTPSPDEGLFAFLRLAEAVESRLDVLGALRDNPPGLQLLADALGNGRVIGELLLHVPDEITQFAAGRDAAALKSFDRLLHEASASLQWRSEDDRHDGLRRFKRREALRITIADVAGKASAGDVGDALSSLADACLAAGIEEIDLPFAVIGMGKLGGCELGYASDIDVMFVHAGDPQAAEKAAEELLRAIGEVTREGQAFRIDAGLRPEGKAGPLARTLDAYLDYYERWSKPWEHLALIKARPAAGDDALGIELVRATRRWAFPESAPSPEHDVEIRHLKARMERERIPRGTDARRNLKVGPGGMSDIEFATQMLQRRHGHAYEDLRTTGTLPALHAAAEHALVDAGDAALLAASYTWLARLRNRLFLLTGRPADALPAKPEVLESVGIALGYRDQPRQEVEEEFLRTTRRVRKIAEPLIYG